MPAQILDDAADERRIGSRTYQIRSWPRRRVPHVDGVHLCRQTRWLPASASAAAGRLDLAPRIEGKRLLDLPLAERERAIRLRDAAMGTPGVFVVEQHVAPGSIELVCRILAPEPAWPTALRPAPAVRRPCGSGPFRGRRRGAIFPVRREIAAHFGDLVAVAILEGVHQAGWWWRSPCAATHISRSTLHELAQLLIGRSVVAADAVADLDHVVGIVLRRPVHRDTRKNGSCWLSRASMPTRLGWNHE